MSADTPGVTNWADGDRAAAAAEAFVMVLSDDPRVRSAYAGWRARHDLDGWLVRLGERETLDAFGDALIGQWQIDLPLVERFVREDLRLPLYADWLAQSLILRFRAWGYTEATGETLDIGLRARRKAWRGLPPGRRQKGGMRDIWRDVEWLYRAEVKTPPDSVRAIAREYALAAMRRTDARSVIQDGIRRAKDLLAFSIVIPLPE